MKGHRPREVRWPFFWCGANPRGERVMSTISVPAFTRKLREVVADEPKAFAYDLGLSLSAVYNYLNGRVPATEVLFRIARYSGRPMEWFLVDETAGAALPASSGELAVPVSYAASGRGGEGT